MNERMDDGLERRWSGWSVRLAGFLIITRLRLLCLVHCSDCLDMYCFWLLISSIAFPRLISPSGFMVTWLDRLMLALHLALAVGCMGGVGLLC